MTQSGQTQYFDEALKVAYSNDQMFAYIAKPVKTLAELERTGDFTVTGPGGRTMITVPVGLGLPQGYNTVGEYGALPTAGRGTYKQASYYSVQHTATFKYSFRAKGAGSDSATGWKAIPVIEMDAVIQGLRQSINRQIFGDSSGKLATCTAGSSQTTITVDQTKFIYGNASNGMYIDLYDTNTTSYVAQGRQVTATTATSITISGAAVSPTSTTIVVNANCYNTEMNGLANIIGTTALGEIDPSTAGYGEWTPAGYAAGSATGTGGAFDALNASPSLSLFQKPFNAVEDNLGTEGEKGVDFIVASTGVQTAAANYLTTFKRIPVQSSLVTLPGGFEGIDWNGVPLGRDKDCPANTAYFVVKSGLKIGEVIPPGWQTLNGDSIVAWDGARSYQSVWIWDMNLCCFARNRLAKMINIAEA